MYVYVHTSWINRYRQNKKFFSHHTVPVPYYSSIIYWKITLIKYGTYSIVVTYVSIWYYWNRILARLWIIHTYVGTVLNIRTIVLFYRVLKTLVRYGTNLNHINVRDETLKSFWRDPKLFVRYVRTSVQMIMNHLTIILHQYVVRYNTVRYGIVSHCNFLRLFLQDFCFGRDKTIPILSRNLVLYRPYVRTYIP